MDQTKIWDYYQNDAEVGDAVFSARPRYEFLARQIAPGMQALDIGVGRGGLEAILVPKGVRMSVLDPGERAIARVRALYALGDGAKVGYSQAIPFPDGQFDVAVMCEVVEHLADDVLDATLREVRRVLKQGGRLIGTLPADENLLDNHVVCPDCGKQFHRWGHVRSVDEGRLRAILSEHFEDVHVARHFFGDVRTLNWKGRLSWGLKKLLVALGIRGGGETFSFSASRR